MERVKIHGFLVTFDEEVRETGAYHLERVLQPDEVKTLFDAARSKGKAYFVNRGGRHFILTHRSDGTYDLEEE